MTKWLNYLPEFTLLASVGLLLNPNISWQQVVSLLLVYLMFVGIRLVQYFEDDGDKSEERRIQKLEEDVRILIQADSFRNLK